MARQEYGLSNITCVAPSWSGYVVQTYDTSESCKSVVTVEDEEGVRKFVSYNDITYEATVDVVYAGATLPTAGATVSFDSHTWEVISVDTKVTNHKEAKKCTFKLMRSEGISYV